MNELTHGMRRVVAVAGIGGVVLAAPALVFGQEAERKVHTSLSVTYTNDYYFRGIIQEDDAFIIQPDVSVGIDLLDWEDGGLSATVGLWSSLHDSATGASSDDDFVDKWYEADFYVGLTGTVGAFELGLTYTAYMSPNDAFNTVNELAFGVTLDDSEWMGAWSLSPSATFAFEIGENAADGGDEGVYLGLGISPGYTFEETPIGDIALSVPVTVGLSLDDYYEDATGDDDTFGYVDVGIEAGIAIPVPDGYGDVSLTAGVHFLFLGDNTKDYNDDDDFETMAFVGLSWSF